ncbi:DUF397 domain-containing protein [Nocardiopsis chromatogenes]|uniref:DUF397 domain-containing protein n=1 Tax=Nocardiopsis chromatogenes TaxID=280239 RepID=UPI000A307F5B|nr:DUF397 domain-containing protein [Nocardiopsis chromatogenes]
MIQNWKKSSYSSAKGEECVEVSLTPERPILLRDSKNPGGPWLPLSAPEWTRFLSMVGVHASD